jgi:hypothetical protein
MKKSAISGMVSLSVLLAVPNSVQAQPFDHLQCHKMKDPHKFDAVVDLEPLQVPVFLPAAGCKIKVKGKEFCVPTNKQVQSTDAPAEAVVGQEQTHDFICYKMKCPKAVISDTEVTDQFGTRMLTNLKPSGKICVPAVKGGPPPTVTTTTTSTTSTSTTSTTLPTSCSVTLSMSDATTLGALQYRVDYSSAGGGFVGTGDTVNCTNLAGGSTLVVFNDEDGSEELRSSVASLAFTGPTDLAVCEFAAAVAPAPGDFVVTVEDSHPASSSGTESNVCGAPSTGSTPPFARDASEVLRVAVGLDLCDLCECDVTGGGITASDSLAVLRASAALAQTLSCPACVGSPVVSGASGSVTVAVSSVVCP